MMPQGRRVLEYRLWRRNSTRFTTCSMSGLVPRPSAVRHRRLTACHLLPSSSQIRSCGATLCVTVGRIAPRDGSACSVTFVHNLLDLGASTSPARQRPRYPVLLWGPDGEGQTSKRHDTDRVEDRIVFPIIRTARFESQHLMDKNLSLII
jgi:hypothetical protein